MSEFIDEIFKRKRKILLVDDEENNLSFMTRCLHNEPYELVKSSSGIEALQLIRNGQHFDVILSDHKMPEMDGIEFLERVGLIDPESIKILVTAYSDADILIDSINKAKVYRYIKKPYKPDELVITVKTAIEYLELKEDNKNLVTDLKDLFSGTIKAIVEALDAKDSFTLGRSRRVTFYALKMGEKLGLSKYLIGELELAGLLHDIGMIGVSDEILYKTDKLTPEEYEEVKMHVTHGVRILEDIEQLTEVVDVVKHHHEHYDGSGYPDKLKGDEIPLLSRIIAITDAYDSMISNRAYRKSMTTEQAVEVIESMAGKQFDPEMVKVFVEILPSAISQIKEFDKRARL